MLRYLDVPNFCRWLITLGFTVIVVVLSVIPGRAEPGDSVFVWLVINTPSALQKTMHVAVYAMLALLFMWTLETIESKSARIAITLVVIMSLGAALEWQQTRVPGRFGTIYDVLLNTLGALVGIILAVFML